MFNWLKNLPDWLRAGVTTGTQSAIGLFIVSLLGFLHNVQEWASDTTGVEHNFPSLEPLGKGLVSVVVGAIVGVGVALFRKVKPGPTYPS